MTGGEVRKNWKYVDHRSGEQLPIADNQIFAGEYYFIISIIGCQKPLVGLRLQSAAVVKKLYTVKGMWYY